MTERQDLSTVAPGFVAMAHRIVWCTVATTDTAGRPRTRVLHPVWEWDGSTLTGWIATSPHGLKARHIESTPFVSLTYWADDHDTCSAECDAEWLREAADLEAGWDRFVNAPEPVGYDPAIVPTWEDASSPDFGILRLHPKRLRVMPGTLMTQGQGQLLNWSAN